MNDCYDIVTIGSSTVDYFADTQSELIRIDTPSHHEALIAFPLGSKVLVESMEILTGGGGTNTATSFARLGLKTAYLGKVGDDANGILIKQALAAEGIDFIGAVDGVSGMSVVLNSFTKDRTILAYKGANNSLALDELQEFKTRWIYLSSMMGQSLETAKAIIQQSDCRLAFNPSNYQAKMGYEALKEIIDRVDFLVMNREEACKFLGIEFNEAHTIEQLFGAFHQLPPRLFVVTDGPNGAYLYDRENLWHAKPAPNLLVKESTGAGDAFASTFTAALIYEMEPVTALRWALTNAESVLKFRGAKEKLLTRDALQQEMEQVKHDIQCIGTCADICQNSE